MKTELEKCLSGEWYDCHAPVFIKFKTKTHKLLLEYNALPYDAKEKKYAILKDMFENIGKDVSVGSPFVCDYGCHITIGNNVSINTGCTLVDCNRITIGNNVLIGPNVQIYTATHPVELNERLTPVETPDGIKYIRHTYALPVTIEDGCWIGGGVIILPGVTIGRGSVIGAGSVVTSSIPADCLAAGNPCKIMRTMDKKTITASVECIAACGLYCGACRKYLKGKCPGCRQNDKAAWCKIRQCCQAKSFGSCADCDTDVKACKTHNNVIGKIFSFLFNSDRAACIRYIQANGYKAFAEEMTRRNAQTMRKR